MTQRILYVEGCRDGTIGGSHISLYSIVANLDRARFQPVVVFYDEHRIAAQMRSLGAEVHIFENRKPFDLRRRLARWPAGLARLAVVALPLQKLANFAWLFLRPTLVAAVFLRRQAIALVHLNNSSSGNHEWMLAALLAGVPYVSHERGVADRLSRSSKWLAGAADGVICISNAIREILVQQGLRRDKAVAIYNGPLVGDTTVEPAYKRNLERVIDDLELGNNVIFTGFGDNSADYVNVMDVFVHLSHEPESFGKVDFESMYLGKPVVSTNFDGPTEIFDTGNQRHPDRAGRPGALAKHLATLLGSPDQRRRLGENARRSVMSKFTIAQMIRGIEQVDQTVLVQIV